MIEAFQNFAQWIVDLGRMLGDFLLNVINGLLQLFKMLPVVTSVTSASITYLPSILAAFVAITITILIVFLIVGRESGG